MAICPVRFEFYCGEEELKYIHSIPRSLITAGDQDAQDAGYSNLFVRAVEPIMKEHAAACVAASNGLCENCGSPRITALQTPMSWLHKVDDPFVAVWVNPMCGKGKCEIQIRQEVQGMMSELMGGGAGRSGSEPRASLEVIPCKVCGKTDAIKRCGRCMVVGYCGKEHQKADWEAHKKICVAKSGPS
jgi:hypothetical protein